LELFSHNEKTRGNKMTSKEIAEATSKPEKTVRTWVKKTGAKMATIEATEITLAFTFFISDFGISSALDFVPIRR
jgi:hypothetical protein